MADAATDEPLRMPDQAAVEAWRKGADADRGGPAPAIADLAPPADDSSVTGLVSSLTELQRKKVDEDTRMSAEFDEQQRRDRAVRNQAFQLEGAAAAELPKNWDAEKQHKKWETDPIDGFGSMGGLFAMVASAFTKAPMENAFNGLASAINSTRDANEQGYQRSFEAFKENVKLADQRFKTQHELYTDALQLGSADAAASEAKFRHAAVKFGDQQMLMLAEHGMIKEIYELQESRAKAHEAMIKSADEIDLHTVQRAAVNAIKMNPPQTGDPVADKLQLAAQIQRVYDGGGKYGSAEQEAVGAFMQKAMRENKSPQEIADGLADVHEKFVLKAPNIEGYRQAVAQEEQANGGTPLTPERNAQLQQMFGLTPRLAGAGTRPTENSVVAEEIKRRTAEYVAGGMSQAEAFDKATKEVKTAERKPDQPKLATENNVIAAEISKRAADYVAGGMEPHAAFDKAMKEIKAAEAKPGAGSGNPALHPEKMELDRRTKQYTDENIAKGMDPDQARKEAFDRASKEVAAAGKVPSGNAKMQLDAQYQKAERMESAMNEMEGLLAKHKFITGIGGTLTRPVEAISNVLGSNETDRKQFQRVATELKEWGQSVVNDRTGRPLSSEAKDASVIFAGLNPGDTGPNTIRAIVELRPVIKRIKEQIKARAEGRGPVSGGSEAPAAPATEEAPKTDWLNAYPEKK